MLQNYAIWTHNQADKTQAQQAATTTSSPRTENEAE